MLALNKLYVVGIGPGEADQMTLRAMRVLEGCEVIAGYDVYVDLVKPLFPEKEYLVTPMRKEAERCRMAIDCACEGKTVAMISSGDAGVYGMAGLIYELAQGRELEVEVVPGVTAALSGGAVLGAVIAARQTRQRSALLLDALAAPGALAIALCRLAEYFSGEGIGMYVEDERFCFFPLAVCNQYEEWYWAIFLLEALAALVILGVLLRRTRPAGDTARLFLILYSASQVLLESMRRDNFLRWLFVRVSQLTAALVMAGLMLYALIQLVRAGRLRGAALRSTIASWAVFLACTGITIVLEFAIDKSADLPVWAAYCLMALCCIGLGAACYQAVLGHRCRIAESAGKPAI